jgi:hypothetical protein
MAENPRLIPEATVLEAATRLIPSCKRNTGRYAVGPLHSALCVVIQYSPFLAVDLFGRFQQVDHRMKAGRGKEAIKFAFFTSPSALPSVPANFW